MVLEHPGTTTFVRRRSLRSDGGPTGGVTWQNVKIVDAAGGGDFTTIQGAIDGITDQSNTNRYLVLINGGDYTEATITHKQYVSVGGRGRDITRILVTNASGGAIVDADDSGMFDLTVVASTSSNLTLSVDTTRLNWFMDNVNISGRSTLGAGQYTNCKWNGVITLNGASDESMPVMENCHFNLTAATNQTLSGGNSGFGQIIGGSVIAASNVSNQSSITGDTTDLTFTGVAFINDQTGGSTGWSFDARAQFTGCTFSRYDGSGNADITPSEARFSGCTFTSGIRFDLPSSGVGPVNFSGCQLVEAIVRLTNSSASFYPVVFSGCLLESASSGALLTQNGSGGNRLVELNGNTYRGTIDVDALDFRFRGTDVEAVLFPPSHSLGTGAAATADHHPVLELNMATETAFIPLRFHPPNGGRGANSTLIDALLVVSSEFDKANDEFTEGSNIALASHTSDSGETWSLVSGTATVTESDDTVEGSAGGIHTWGASGAHGFVEIESKLASSSALKQRLLFRYSDTDNYWAVEMARPSTNADMELRLLKRVSGSETIIAETDIGGSGTITAVMGVSFLGNTIKVFCDTGVEEPGLVFETSDSFNNTATVVGLFFAGTGADNFFDKLKFWRGDTTSDLTVDADFGSEGAPLDHLTDSLTLANQPIAHHVFSYIDIKDALNNLQQGGIVGVRVTLDALGTVNTAIYVHGIIVRKMPTNKPVANTQSTVSSLDRQQITYR